MAATPTGTAPPGSPGRTRDVVANKLTGVAAALEQLPIEVVERAVERFDILAKESASRVVGGGATMRMHTRRGRVGVPLSTKSNMSGGSAYINGVPAAQWRWIEDGTKPHAVGRRGDFLKGPGYGHPMRAPIGHPGSRGPHAWTRAVEEFRAEFPDIAIEILKEVTG